MSDFEDNQALEEMSVEQILATAKRAEMNLMEHYRELKLLERECLDFHKVNCAFNYYSNTEIQNNMRSIIEAANDLDVEIARMEDFLNDTTQQFNALEEFMIENQEMFDPPDSSDEIESVEILNSQQETEDIL